MSSQIHIILISSQPLTQGLQNHNFRINLRMALGTIFAPQENKTPNTQHVIEANRTLTFYATKLSNEADMVQRIIKWSKLLWLGVLLGMFAFEETYHFSTDLNYFTLFIYIYFFFSYKIDRGFVVNNWPSVFNYFSGMVNFSQLTYLIPKFTIRNSTAAAVEFWILLSISTYLIPKL